MARTGLRPCTRHSRSVVVSAVVGSEHSPLATAVAPHTCVCLRTVVGLFLKQLTLRLTLVPGPGP